MKQKSWLQPMEILNHLNWNTFTIVKVCCLYFISSFFLKLFYFDINTTRIVVAFRGGFFFTFAQIIFSVHIMLITKQDIYGSFFFFFTKKDVCTLHLDCNSIQNLSFTRNIQFNRFRNWTWTKIKLEHSPLKSGNV